MSSSFESVDFLFSQNVFTQGRLQVSFGRNFVGSFNTLRFSLVVDFNKVRSSSTYNNTRSSSSFTQNIRGSVGYDTNYNNFLFTSRNQVGRSGAAIKLFVDNNANKVFDEGDDSIEENAVRIHRSGSSSMLKNGILYYTQMQPYFFYNMELNKGAVRNPMLVPTVEKFGMITDPNRFKKIEVPFYMSGVVEGRVEREFESGKIGGVSGLKINLTQADGDFSQEIRTFSDGSFYAYEVPPGEYELSADSAQLRILKTKSYPDKYSFSVQAIPEGDFVEGIKIMLYPEDQESPALERETREELLSEIINDQEVKDWEGEMADNVDEALRLIIRAQNAFYERNFDNALAFVNQSLELYETAQGYALKGSLNYLRGNKNEAQNNWEKAIQFNPDTFIPDVEMLDRLIIIEQLE